MFHKLSSSFVFVHLLIITLPLNYIAGLNFNYCKEQNRNCIYYNFYFFALYLPPHDCICIMNTLLDCFTSKLSKYMTEVI